MRIYRLNTSEGTPKPATWPMWRGPFAYGQATAERMWVMTPQLRGRGPVARPHVPESGRLGPKGAAVPQEQHRPTPQSVHQPHVVHVLGVAGGDPPRAAPHEQGADREAKFIHEVCGE